MHLINMDKNMYNSEILSILESWAYLGESVNSSGSRLIGHLPLIAPRAYINIIFPPLSQRNILTLEQTLMSPLPKQYKEFLAFANGLNVYSDALRVFGFVPLKKESGSDVFTYPANLVIHNDKSSIKGLQSNEMIVAWYKADGSYVKINENGRAVRFDALSSGRIICEWQDFDVWLTSEIARLNSDYEEGKISVFNPNQKKGVKSNTLI